MLPQQIPVFAKLGIWLVLNHEIAGWKTWMDRALSQLLQHC